MGIKLPATPYKYHSPQVFFRKMESVLFSLFANKISLVDLQQQNGANFTTLNIKN